MLEIIKRMPPIIRQTRKILPLSFLYPIKAPIMINNNPTILNNCAFIIMKKVYG